MKDLNSLIDCLKGKTEETFKFYAEKEHWTPEDLEALKNATKAFDKMQTIQMNMGIWENMKEGRSYGDHRSMARYPHMSYGSDMYYDDRYYGHNDASYMRGRDGATGRYMSREVPMYHDGRSTHSVKDQAIQRLENLMDAAQSDYEREQVRKMIEAVEGQK